MGKVSRSYRLDEELVGRVEACAKELGQSYTVFVERALERALDVKVGRRTPLTDREHEAIAHAREGLDATPLADAVAKMPRARSLVGKDSAAMERQRKMNEAKGL